MKKLLILIPLFIFSCMDTEMVVPGENIGDVDGIDLEDPAIKLTKYQSDYTNAKFDIDINEEGQIKKIGEYVLSTTDGQISEVEIGNKTFSLSYTNSELASITNAANNELIEISKVGNRLNATRSNGSGNIANYTFQLDSRSYIMGYEARFENGQLVSANFQSINNNISQITYNDANADTQIWSYMYDAEINPMQKIGEKDYNTLMLLEVINAEIGKIPAFLPFVLLVNNNNMVHSEVNDLSLDIFFEYENYTENLKLPKKGRVRDAENNKKGNVTYTYQD